MLIDGVDVSHEVTEVTWHLKAGGLPTATFTFVDVYVDAAAELLEEARTLGLTAKDWAYLRDHSPVLANLLEKSAPAVARERAVPAGSPLPAREAP